MAHVASSSSTASTSNGGSTPSCVEGAACYFGLDGTEGIGSCTAGTTSCEGGVPSCSDVRPKVQDCASDDPNCDGITGCTGLARWAQSGFMGSSKGVAAGPDGTVALVGQSTAPMGFFVQTFDARGRACWGAATVFNGGGSLTPFAVAVAGEKLAADGTPTQVVCSGSAPALAARAIVVGQAAPI
jgi:hypothetical protein